MSSAIYRCQFLLCHMLLPIPLYDTAADSFAGHTIGIELFGNETAVL